MNVHTPFAAYTFTQTNLACKMMRIAALFFFKKNAMCLHILICRKNCPDGIFIPLLNIKQINLLQSSGKLEEMERVRIRQSKCHTDPSCKPEECSIEPREHPPAGWSLDAPAWTPSLRPPFCVTPHGLLPAVPTAALSLPCLL